ncbi:hypothetical protein [Paraburkholderia sp. GAS334]
MNSGLAAVRGRRDYPLGAVRDAGLPRADVPPLLLTGVALSSGV